MNTQSPDVVEFPREPQSVPPQAAATRPLYWSVRRELWENRFLYMAPVMVSCVVLFATVASMYSLPRTMRTLSALEPMRQHVVAFRPFSLAAAVVMFSTFLCGLFYSLDALYGERRDRSIFFWKSLPVSDATTVVSKAAVPMVVLPLIGFGLSVITQLSILFFATMILTGSGVNPAVLWAHISPVQGPVVMIYGLAVHALWIAPLYGWLMFVSAWARRAPLLWGVLPVLAIGAVEKIAFNTEYFCNFLQYRFLGAMSVAFTKPVRGGGGIIDRLAQLTPLTFLTSPGMWLGLFVAAGFFYAATRVRRHRGPA